VKAAAKGTAKATGESPPAGQAAAVRESCQTGDMATFIFRCPNTGQNVQGNWSSEDAPEHGYTYLLVQCTACLQLHFLNPLTGKVLGSDDDDGVDDDF
jgi:hypothetical protein